MTERSTSTVHLESSVGDTVMSDRSDCATVIATRPMIGAPHLLIAMNSRGKYPSAAHDRATSAIVNCQLKSEPKHEITIIAITTWPTVWLNMCAKTSPNGAFDAASCAPGTMPWISSVEPM